MLTVPFILSIVSLLFIKADDWLVNNYLPIYESKLKYLFEEQLIISFKDYSFVIDNFVATRQSMNIDKTIKMFKFRNALYTFIFNLKVINNSNGKSIYKKNQVIEHLYDEIVFEFRSDRTLSAKFLHDKYQCNFFLLDIFTHKIFSNLKIFQEILCNRLSEKVRFKISQFTDNIPLNINRFNFEDLIMLIGCESDKRSLSCDNQLNQTHKVVNFNFNNITFAFEETDNDISNFFNIRVNITYSQIDINKTISEEVTILSYASISFSKNHITFSEKRFGNKYLCQLIETEMSSFEKNRLWIDLEHE